MAGIAQAFVNRPIMATAVNLVLLIIGLLAYDHLELRHKPNETRSQITVKTFFPGSNSEVVEQRITKPLEDLLSGIDGIKKMNSTSTDGQSHIFLSFKPGVDSNKIMGQVRDRLFSAQGILPENVRKPEIEESNESNPTLVYLIFQDNTRSEAALTDYMRRNIEEKLRLVEGVAGFNRFGDKIYTVTVELDPAKLAEHQVSVMDVLAALRQEKAFASGGEIETSIGKRTVILSSLIQSPVDLEKISVKIKPDFRVTIGDLGRIRIVEKPTFLKIRVNGQYMAGISVTAKPQANPLQVAARVTQFVSDLKKTMPNTMTATVYDMTKPFGSSVKEIKKTLWEAVFLVGIIVTVSLASMRAALLPIITIPLCLIGSFALMWLFGFSINPITLLALVLAVGLVVDDAIVVVENIHHHMESGLSALQAAKKGMKEISFAVIVMTITLAAVYVPIAFQADESTVMFKEFAWTLAGSVIISGFVALTLTPALSGQFLKSDHSPHYWAKLTRVYRQGLTMALHNPIKICLLGVFVAMLGIYGFLRLPSELLPIEDEDFLQGYVLVKNDVPDKLRADWFKSIETVIQNTVPEREGILNGQYEHWMFSHILLKPRSERKAGIHEIYNRLQPELSKIVGPMVGVSLGGNSAMGGEDDLKILIQYSGELPILLSAVKNMIQDIQSLGFEKVQSEQVDEKTRIKIKVDRALANELGVNIASIEDSLHTLLSGRKVTDYNFKGYDYDVEVRAEPQFRKELDSINGFFVPGGQGQWIPLGSLVTFKEVQEPTQIKHYERLRGAAISIGLKPNVSLGESLQLIEPVVKQHLPQDARYRFGGKAERYKEARQTMWLTYGLALVFIYLVLTALFESFVHPFVVLLTVPLSVTGAVWAVNAIGGSNNIFTSIGLVTLIGLITKHGILIVDFSNRLKQSGHSLFEAVIQASSSRLRPVLMTTFAMVFGAIPLIFSLGAGAVARQHIGWIIIGGMLTGTIFSLFVVPVVYCLIEGKRKT